MKNTGDTGQVAVVYCANDSCFSAFHWT